MRRPSKTRVSGQGDLRVDRAPKVAVQSAGDRDRELVLAALDRDLAAWEEYQGKLPLVGRVLLDEARLLRAKGNVDGTLFALRELQRRAR